LAAPSTISAKTPTRNAIHKTLLAAPGWLLLLDVTLESTKKHHVYAEQCEQVSAVEGH